MALSANDFVLGSLTGTVFVRNGYANINLKTEPRIFEGNKSFVVRLRRGAADGPVITETPAITIQDNSEFVSLTPNVTTFSEGDSVQFTLLTANAANNATLYFSTLSVGGNINSQDFFTSNSGTFVIVDNSANIVLTANTDFFAIDEGADQFKLQIRTQGTEGNVVIVSDDTIQIKDTSNTFRIESIEYSTVGPIIESESLRVVVRTVNGYGNAAATLYYTTTGNADVSGSATGAIVINENYGEVEIAAESSVPENEEREFTIQVRSGSVAGDILSVSDNIIVAPYISGTVNSNISLITRLAANTQGMVGGGSCGFDILTIGATNGEVLYYNSIGELTNDDLTNGNTGSTVVTDNGANIIFTAVSPFSGNSKRFGVEVRRGSVSGIVIANTSPEAALLSNTEGYIQATGGTIDDSESGYRKHIFDTSNIFNISLVSFNPARNTINLFLVGGGGHGGASSGGGGGGGAGGFISTNVPLAFGGEYVANVGAGGAGYSSGSNSQIFSYIALGGGAGGRPGNPGGSGGGGSAPAIPGGTGLQPTLSIGSGNPGGNAVGSGIYNASAGGGGGATEAGIPGSAGGAGGRGGYGLAVPYAPATIGGSSTAMPWPNPAAASTPGGTRYFAGGGGSGSDQRGGGPGGQGGGGAGNPSAPGVPLGGLYGRPAIPTSGGGGGGGGHAGGAGGAGGSGVIIIRYPYA